MLYRIAQGSLCLLVMALIAGCGGGTREIFDRRGVNASGSLNASNVSGIPLFRNTVTPGSGHVISSVYTDEKSSRYTYEFTFLSSVFNVEGENGTRFPVQQQVVFGMDHSKGTNIEVGKTYSVGTSVIPSLWLREIMSPREKAWVASEGSVHVDSITGTAPHGRTYTLTLSNIKLRAFPQVSEPIGTDTLALSGTITVKDIE